MIPAFPWWDRRWSHDNWQEILHGPFSLTYVPQKQKRLCLRSKVEGKNWLLKVVLRPPHSCHAWSPYTPWECWDYSCSPLFLILWVFWDWTWVIWLHSKDFHLLSHLPGPFISCTCVRVYMHIYVCVFICMCSCMRLHVHKPDACCMSSSPTLHSSFWDRTFRWIVVHQFG